MASAIRMPRLTQRDVVELKRAAELMASAGRSLHASSWQGAPAVAAIVADVYATLAGLYNRAEPVFLLAMNSGSTANAGACPLYGCRLEMPHEHQEGEVK